MPSGELPSFLQIISMALRLEPQVFLAVQVAPNGIWVALAVVALAGVSEALGQSLILFLNHIRPRALAWPLPSLRRPTWWAM